MVEVSTAWASGFATQITVKPRDLAIVSANLAGGAVTVEVMPPAQKDQGRRECAAWNVSRGLRRRRGRRIPRRP